MGMDPFNFADALLGILGSAPGKKTLRLQRGLSTKSAGNQGFHQGIRRRVAPYRCLEGDEGGESQKLFEDWMERYGKDGKLTLYRAVGCDKCGKTGYKGRIGLHELMIADDAAKKLIQERAAWRSYLPAQSAAACGRSRWMVWRKC
jgi:type II secretory ATPase GspE/PulE/Tfp pilus assembly ATPase PilB-like protein